RPKPGSIGGGSTPGPGAGSSPTPPAEGTPGAPAKRDPLAIASVGTISGPIGAVFAPGGLAVQAWANYVNTKGGVNGHTVNLLVYDDGGDPARHRSQVQEAIERRHVVAFVYNPESIAGRASQEYISSKRVPVIGDEGGS